jgi:transcriptional regulator with XRE-family HTH domain
MNDFIPSEGDLVDRAESGFSVTEKIEPVVSGSETKLKNTESSEDSIRQILSSYDIGQKLRQLRLRKKIALVDLGKHTGLSASMLSQLENGKLIPTLPTLARVAMVFDVGLDFFFGEKRSRRVFSIVRAGDRYRFPELSENPVPGYYFEVLAYGAVDKNMSAYLAEFPKLAATNVSKHSHDGSEFVHVLHGSLAINYQSEEHILETGDSVYFDSSEAHSYHGKSDVSAKAIVITTPSRL